MGKPASIEKPDIYLELMRGVTLLVDIFLNVGVVLEKVPTSTHYTFTYILFFFFPRDAAN